MSTNEKTLPFKPSEISDENALAAKLEEQKNLKREIIGFRLIEGSEGNLSCNFASYIMNPYAKELPKIEVIKIPQDASEQDTLRKELSTRTAIGYAEVAFTNRKETVLIAYAERCVVYDGATSHFGGPNDSVVREDEGLAIVTNSNFDQFRQLFRNQDKGGEYPHARNLDPDARYIACRWNRSVTPYDQLINCKIFVCNPSTGDIETATAVDYGPNPSTGRASDLSPGLESLLTLKTNDRCIVRVFLGKVLSETLAAREAKAQQNPQMGPRHLAVVGTPDGVQYLNEREIIQIFGDLRPIQERANGAITVSTQFTAKIVRVQVPELANIAGAPQLGVVECHEKIVNHLKAAFQQIAAAGLLDRIVRWDGLFVPRHILHDRSRGLSTHSWGIAFDINAKYNGYNAVPAPKGAYGSVEELVPIFEANGFYWGGRFSHPDGMHFQWGRLQA